MGAVNRVFLMGNLTRDPQVRQTPGGTPVSDLGMAVSERYRNREGAMVEATCFADVVVWGKQAELCGQYLSKGAPVFVEGRLQFDQWQTENGEKRSRLRVRADRVQFLGGKKGGSNDPEATEPAAEAVPAPKEKGGDEAMPF